MWFHCMTIVSTYSTFVGALRCEIFFRRYLYDELTTISTGLLASFRWLSIIFQVAMVGNWSRKYSWVVFIIWSASWRDFGAGSWYCTYMRKLHVNKSILDGCWMTVWIISSWSKNIVIKKRAITHRRSNIYGVRKLKEQYSS